MSQPELDSGVRALLETELDSFEKLEIMRALRAAARPMSQQELGAACQLEPEVVEEALDALERANLITRERSRRIRPGGRCAEPSFTALMQLYADDRARILAMVSSVAVRRIRSMAVTAFAEAFKSRKGRNGNG